MIYPTDSAIQPLNNRGLEDFISCLPLTNHVTSLLSHHYLRVSKDTGIVNLINSVSLTQPSDLLGNYFLPYQENRSTWNLTNFPSRLGGFTRLSVISIHSFFSSSEFRNNTPTLHVVGSRFKACCSRREIGSWMVTGFKNCTASEQLIRSIGPRNISSNANSSFGTSWIYWLEMIVSSC